MRLRLIVRLLVEIARLIADVAKRQRKTKKQAGKGRPRGSVKGLETEIEALIGELRKLERIR